MVNAAFFVGARHALRFCVTHLREMAASVCAKIILAARSADPGRPAPTDAGCQVFRRIVPGMVTRRTLIGSALIAPLMSATLKNASASTSPAVPAAVRFAPTLFELRNYATAPGQRDALIEMFERTFLDAYENGGTSVLGTFRVVGDEDRWVWMRAFRDAPSRGAALTNFYSSAEWQALAGPANATIASIDYAMLLRQRSGGVFADPSLRSPAGAAIAVPSVIRVDIHLAKVRKEGDLADAFWAKAAPALSALGAAPFASFVTDRSENSYPRQRIRKASAFVTLTRFETLKAHTAFNTALKRSAAWKNEAAPAIEKLSAKPSELLILHPTARSSIR